MASHHRLLPLAFLGAAVLTSCIGATAPRPSGELVAVVGGEAASIAIVSPGGLVVARPGPIQPFKDAGALSPDGKTLWVVAAGDGGRELVAIDNQTLKIRSRLALNSPVAAHAVDGVYVYGTALAIDPSDSRIVAGGAFLTNTSPPLNGEFVTVLDSGAQRVLATVGPLQAREGLGLVTLPPGPALRSGGVLAVGSRLRKGFGTPVTDRLWVLSASALAIVDSVTPEPLPPPGQDAMLIQVIASPDGRRAYVLSSSGMIYAYDLATRTVVASASALGPGRLSIAPEGNSLYLTDPGDGFDRPGSGLIYVYGANLEQRAPIDLRPAFGGIAQVSTGTAVSGDGRRLYVATGTAHQGPNFGPQRLHLTVVDLVRHTVGRPIPIGDWGPAIPVVLPPQ